MPAEARVTKLWKQQKALIPVLFLGFAAYFLWDGTVGYPRNDERFDAHERLKADPEAWNKLCQDKGWKAEAPKERMGHAKYMEQISWGAGAGVVGLAALAYWFLQKGKIIRNDTEAVTTPGGVRVPYDAIQKVDRTKWGTKGFAYIHYVVEGKPGQLTLDDAKYDPKALDTILKETIEKVSGRAAVEG